MSRELLKYVELANWIRDKISSKELAEGEKMYSENELVSMFGVSRQTVRQAIGMLEREGIVDRRRGSGTYIKGTKSQRLRSCSMTIGVVSTYVDSYIFPSIIKGIESELSKSGYSMQVSFTHNQISNEKRVVRAMIESGVDGLIVEPTKSGLPSPNIDLYREVRGKSIPLLFFHAYYPDTGYHHVTMDDYMAGKKITEYLIGMGHKSIAGMFQLDDLQGHRRYLGYVDALRTAGLEVDSNKVLWFSTEDIPFFGEDISRVMRAIENCTALLCYNDQIAFDMLGKLKARNISVPEDISLVGIDNSDLSAISKPAITTVAHPMGELGRKVAKNMLRLIEDEGYNATYEFHPPLIVRNSVKRI